MAANPTLSAVHIDVVNPELAFPHQQLTQTGHTEFGDVLTAVVGASDEHEELVS